MTRDATRALGRRSAGGDGAALPRCQGREQGMASLPGLAWLWSCCWRLSCGHARITDAPRAPCERGKLRWRPEESSWGVVRGEAVSAEHGWGYLWGGDSTEARPKSPKASSANTLFKCLLWGRHLLQQDSKTRLRLHIFFFLPSFTV